MTFKEKITTGISYLLHRQKRKLIRIAKEFKLKTGIEIGGPSSFFSLRSYMPVYLYAKKVDGVNFSTNTVWEGKLSEGDNFSYYKGKHGYQYISEATYLPNIPTGRYDFVLSCHCLEHTANPLKALTEWNRILNNKGVMVLVLPDKNYTFDERRPVTLFQHLLQDFDNETKESDSTHFDEVIKFHKLEKDNVIQTMEQLIERTKNNHENRCVHHHVFDFSLIKQLMENAGFSVRLQQWVAPFHLVTIAQKIY